MAAIGHAGEVLAEIRLEAAGGAGVGDDGRAGAEGEEAGAAAAAAEGGEGQKAGERTPQASPALGRRRVGHGLPRVQMVVLPTLIPHLCRHRSCQPW